MAIESRPDKTLDLDRSSKKAFASLISLYKRVVSFFGQDKIQKIVLISFVTFITLIISVRDIANLYLNKWILIALMAFFLVFLNKKNILYSFAFFIPLLSGLPWNYTLLIYSAILVIKSGFKVNAIEITLPLFILVLELLLYFFYQVKDLTYIEPPITSNAPPVIHVQNFAEDMKDIIFYAISFFMFTFICTHSRLDLKMRTLVVYLSVGILIQCAVSIIIAFIVTNNAYEFSKYRDADYWMYFLNDSRRYLDTHETIGQLNKLTLPDHLYIPKNDLLISNNPNLLTSIIIFAVSYLSCSFKKGRTKDNVTGIILITMLILLGFFARSRTFIVMLAALIVLLFIFYAFKFNFSFKNIILIGFIILAFLALFLLVMLISPKLFDLVLGRFDEGGTNGREHLFVVYSKLFVSDINIFLFGTGASRMQLIGLKVFGEPWAIISSTGMKGTGPFNTVHFGLQQLFVGYGVLGSIVIISFFYIIIRNRLVQTKVKNILYFVPFLMVMINSTALQLFTPANTMVVLAFAVLSLNNGESLEVRKKESILLSDIFSIGAFLFKKKPIGYAPEQKGSIERKLLFKEDKTVITKQALYYQKELIYRTYPTNGLLAVSSKDTLARRKFELAYAKTNYYYQTSKNIRYIISEKYLIHLIRKYPFFQYKVFEEGELARD